MAFLTNPKVKVLMLKGEKGDSAYQVAVNNGYTGTEEEWKDSFINAENYYNKPEVDTIQTNQNNKINKKPYYFNNVEDMKNSTDLAEGDMVITKGYYSANDGGSAKYHIVTETTKYSEDLSNGLKAELIIDKEVNVKQFGATGNGTTPDDIAIQNCFDMVLPLNTSIYIPGGNYLLEQTIDVKVQNNSYIKLDNNARLFANTNIGSIFDISTSASFFKIDGGQFDGNSVVNYGINSKYQTSKYSPTYENIYFSNFIVSSMKIKSPEHKGGSEHGFITNCKFYNQNTLATCLSVYTHDYTISNCEFFYTNTAIITTGFMLISNSHIWAGGVVNTNNNTIGILHTGDRLILNNMYFDGMNTCVDTNNSSQTIIINNSTCLFPMEGTYDKPIIVRNTIYGNTFINNIDIKSYKEKVSKIKLSNYKSDQINSYSNCINGINEVYTGDAINYDYSLIDIGDNINFDSSNAKIISKGFNQTLENNKYYQIGYAILRDKSVSGFDLTFTSDDLNKYTQRVKCTLYNSSDLNVSVQSNISKYDGEEGRMGIALGNAITLTDGSNNIKCCPIYLHTINIPGNGFGIAVTNNLKTTGNCVVFNNGMKFNITSVDSPNLLFDDIANS